MAYILPGLATLNITALLVYGATHDMKGRKKETSCTNYEFETQGELNTDYKTQPDTPRHKQDTTRHNRTKRHNQTQLDTTRQNWTQPDTTRHNRTQLYTRNYIRKIKMTGTEQHTSFGGGGGGGMDEDRRLTITWSYERTWRRVRYRQAVET